MGDLEIGFRSAVVGGFQRDDVLKYIEEAAQKHAEEIAELKDKLDKAEQDAKTQAEKVAELTQKNAGLLERLGEMTMELDKAKADLDERDRSLALAGEESTVQNECYEELHTQYKTLESECARLREQNQKLQARSDEYTAARDHLAEIELCAHRRAQELEEQAQKHAAQIEADAERRIEAMKRELENTRQEYSNTLRRTQQAADEARRRTEEILNRLGSGSETPTEKNPPAPAPERHTALDDVLRSVKPARNGGNPNGTL